MKSNENTKQLYDKISLFRTTNEVSDSLTKLNKKNIPNINIVETSDSFTLLLSTIKVLMGETGLIDTINGMNKDLGKYQKTFNEKFLMEFKAESGGNSLPIYEEYVTNGFNINVTTLDKHREYFKDDINYKKGSLDNFLYSLIRNPNKEVMYVNNILFKYNNTTGNIGIRFTDPNAKIEDIVNSILNKNKLNNSDDILFDVLDDLFNLSNKSESFLKEKFQINNVLVNDILTTVDDSYYEFTRDDVQYIENKITLKGVYYYGEPTIDGKFDMEDYKNYKNSPNNLGLSSLTIIMNLLLATVAPKYIEIARKNFFERFLSSYKNVIMNNILLSTEMVLIYNICFKSNLDKTSLLKSNRDFLRCTSKSFINGILSTLYNIVKREVLKLIANSALIYAKETITMYKKILSSLRLF